jgi:hypothetical protein
VANVHLIALGVPGRRIRGKVDGPLTQREARAYARLLPFQNIVGVRNVLDAYLTSLPE